MKVWVFVAQEDGEAVGPFVFDFKPSNDDIRAALEALGFSWDDVYRRQLTEEDVISHGP